MADNGKSLQLEDIVNVTILGMKTERNEIVREFIFTLVFTT